MTTDQPRPAPSKAAPPPQHTLQPTTRFTDRAADYAKYRPSYPPAAIDAILENLAPPAELTAADIGAGTGISAALLAHRGVRVIAIEPNAAMREVGAAATPHVRIEWRSTTAELTGLDDNAVDLILCAQAFHWFNPPLALREFHRILRPRGRLALMWNNIETSDPCSAEYRRTFIDAGTVHLCSDHDFDPNALRDSGLYANVRTLEFPSLQRLDLPGLIGRAMSASYAPRHGPAADRLKAALNALHARYAAQDGFVTLRYSTRVHLASRL